MMESVKLMSLISLSAVLGCGGLAGEDGQDGTSCSVAAQGNGTSVITCTDGTSVTIHDGATGATGATGPQGADGTSCAVADNGDGTRTITCGESSVTVRNGTDAQLRAEITDVRLNPVGTTAAFSFRCSRDACTFECALDGAALESCTSPAAYQVSASGAHELHVRAIAGGDTSSETVYVWTARNVSANHVILLIGDGFQREHQIAASRYLYGNDDGMSWSQFPVEAYVATWDVSAYDRYAFAGGRPPYNKNTFDPNVGYDVLKGGAMPYPLANPAGADDYFLTELGTFSNPTSLAVPATDSASAATAYAAGVKTDSGNIAWLPGDPENGALRTIAERARDELGFRIGVTSTVPFTHATPAAFVAHNVYRNNYYTGRSGYTGVGLAEDIIFNVKPDVVIGAGDPLFDNPSWSTTGGYISQTAWEAIQADPDYVFVDRQAGVDGGAALAAAAADAVSNGKKLFGLFGGPDGNFESPIPADDPGHPAVAPATDENPTMADSVLAALDVLSGGGNGFFLMAEQGDIDWANHANDYARMIGCMWDFDEAVKAVEDFVDQPDDDIDWTNTLLIVTTDHGNSYLRLSPSVTLGAGDLPAQNADGTYPDGEVTYSTGEHTNELVSAYAKGNAAVLLEEAEGVFYPGTKIIDNTQIYEAMRTAAGL